MPFKYQPEWQGPLSGRSFEKQTEDFLNAIESRVDEIDTRQTPSDATPMPPGVGDAGTSLEYSRGDHSHPAQDTVSGNAGTATRLAEGRTITLSNEGTGAAFFDGSADVTLPLEVSCIAAGSSARRTIADRFSDIINVKDYGAKGDGETDDTQAIKAAIAAMKQRKVLVGTSTTAGPLLYFPYGVYLIGEQLTVSWAQRVGVFLDGAIVRATAAMDAMLYIDNCWMEGCFLEGGCFDMGRLASVGVQVTGSNNKFYINNVTIKNVGQNHIGLYLGKDGESHGDGEEYRVTNVRVTDWISNSSDQNGNLLYDATGILIAVNDCHFNNITVGCFTTCIRLTGGGHTFSAVHVWQGVTMNPSNDRWDGTIGIKDEAGDNEWDNLYLDNCCTGYWIGSSKNLAIGNLQVSRHSPSTIIATTKKASIISAGKVTCINIDFMYCRLIEPIGNIETRVVFNRDAVSSDCLFPSAGYVHMKHNIKINTGFKLLDPAFMGDNAGMKALGRGSNSTLTAGYYLLGYLGVTGTGAAFFTVGMTDASAEIELSRYGSTVNLTCTQKTSVSSGADNAYFAVGNSFSDDTYDGITVLPVYVKRTTSAWSNIVVTCKTRVSNWAFYKNCKAYCVDAIEPSPSILIEKTFSNT